MAVGLPKNRPPTHPGEVLREDFLKPLGLSQKRLAEAIGVSYPQLNEVVNEKRGVTPDTAVRLAAFFGTSAEVWMGLQADVDLYEAQKEARRRGTLRKIERARQRFRNESTALGEYLSGRVEQGHVAMAS